MNKLKDAWEWVVAVAATVGCWLLVILFFGLIMTIFGGLIYAMLGM